MNFTNAVKGDVPRKYLKKSFTDLICRQSRFHSFRTYNRIRSEKIPCLFECLTLIPGWLLGECFKTFCKEYLITQGTVRLYNLGKLLPTASFLEESRDTEASAKFPWASLFQDTDLCCSRCVIFKFRGYRS